jgi:hypothetical protein
MSGNGSWNGITAPVTNVVAGIGIGQFRATTERSELGAFIDTLYTDFLTKEQDGGGLSALRPGRL